MIATDTAAPGLSADYLAIRTYRLRWLDIGASEWASVSTVEGGKHIALQPPSAGPWLALIESE